MDLSLRAVWHVSLSTGWAEKEKTHSVCGVTLQSVRLKHSSGNLEGGDRHFRIRAA